MIFVHFCIKSNEQFLSLIDKNEVANVIFLLAISKDEYEDTMSIYNLFVNFVKEKSTKRLLNSQSFSEFEFIVKDSFGRMTLV